MGEAMIWVNYVYIGGAVLCVFCLVVATMNELKKIYENRGDDDE